MYEMHHLMRFYFFMQLVQISSLDMALCTANIICSYDACDVFISKSLLNKASV